MLGIYRTLVYLEGDASLRSFEDQEGRKQFNLNIVQRTSYTSSRCREDSLLTRSIGHLDVLKRGNTDGESQ